MKEYTMAGPVYCAAVVPVSTKMPAPMMAPIPKVIRFTGPSTRLSECSPTCPASSRSVLSGFRMSMLAIVSVEVIACSITLALADYPLDGACVTVKQEESALVQSYTRCVFPALRPQRAERRASELDPHSVRSGRHRWVSRSVRGFLPIRLRHVDEEESHPARPGRVGPLRRAPGAQSDDTPPDSRRSCQTRARPRRGHAEDRRLLRRLHGRESHRCQGPLATRTGIGPHQRSPGKIAARR